MKLQNNRIFWYWWTTEIDTATNINIYKDNNNANDNDKYKRWEIQIRMWNKNLYKSDNNNKIVCMVCIKIKAIWQKDTHIFFPILLSMENTCFLKNVMVPLYIHNVTLLMRYIKQLLFSFKIICNAISINVYKRLQVFAVVSLIDWKENISLQKYL